MDEFTTKNWKLERSEDNFANSKCRVTGKGVIDDFYMYPSGYICLPSATPSPDVCPLTGQILTPYPVLKNL